MLDKEIKVLLIDDDEDDFISIRDLLREIKADSYKLTWKSTYNAGLEALSGGDFDVCLLDYRLGEQNGLELLSEHQKSGNFCPTIILTGFGDFELDIKAMQMGAYDYLVKEKMNGPLLERSLRYSFKRGQDMKELREEKENFRTLFNSTFEGIIVYRNGIVLDLNDGAARILHCNPSDIVNTSLVKWIRADYVPEFLNHLTEKIGQPQELVALTKDNEEIYVEVSSRLVVLKGEPTTLVAIRDLTQRKEMEEQILRQDRLASLGLLASSLAHEIGTPLGVIRGRAQMIADKTTEPKTKEDMKLVISQIDRISKLVNSLLHLAREQKSSVSVSVNVRSVLEDVTRLIQHEMERNEITFLTETEADYLVRAEPGPLGQVILNLLVNSIHAIQEAKKRGRSTDHKMILSVSEESDSVVISISDTGCGIDSKNLKNLFKPFFTTKDIGLGTGLGLATSYKIIQSWGGSVVVSTKVDQGTTFTIHLKKST